MDRCIKKQDEVDYRCNYVNIQNKLTFCNWLNFLLHLVIVTLPNISSLFVWHRSSWTNWVVFRYDAVLGRDLNILPAKQRGMCYLLYFHYHIIFDLFIIKNYFGTLFIKLFFRIMINVSRCRFFGGCSDLVRLAQSLFLEELKFVCAESKISVTFF